jgi:hypothetical protein
MGQAKCSDRFLHGGPHIGIVEKRSTPIGVGGGEIGATRNRGATIIRRDGIIPPMIGEDAGLTLANYPLVPTLRATAHSASIR